MPILVQKNRIESRYNMVRLQFFLHDYFNSLGLTSSDLDCATNLAIYGYDSSFFKKVVDKGVFRSEQSARNCMSKLRSAQVLVKNGKGWSVNPEISIGVDDVILLQLKAKNNPE